jgi:hypothetical protein
VSENNYTRIAVFAKIAAELFELQLFFERLRRGLSENARTTEAARHKEWEDFTAKGQIMWELR